MKLLTRDKPYQGKLRYNLSFGVWRKRIIVFGLVNLLLWAFLPGVFYFCWDTVHAMSSNLANKRAYYHVKRSKGRTMADVYATKKVWGEAIKGMNPLTWGN